MMDKADVLIIGAGATGLMAAHTLAKQGKKVIVLEARDRLGGRIHTIINQLFFKYAELGAEFVHGDLPVTLNLLKEAGIKAINANAGMVRHKNEKFIEDGEFIENWDLLLDELNKLEKDTSIADFLQQKFSAEKYAGLRAGVWNFVSGYDTADPRKASAFALLKEWQSEDEGAQHRVAGGYGAMIAYLANSCKAHGGTIYLDTVVKKINWENGLVSVIAADMEYTASQAVIALPLGVLQAGKNETGAVVFNPSIPPYTKAIKAMGFGAVIKFLLEFDSAFWEGEAVTKLAGKSLKNMGYLLSGENIPTWWTQHPKHTPVLTGWIGGPAADDKKDDTSAELLQQGLESLSNIFKISAAELKDKLIAWNIVNWTTEPFTRGSYSYDTVAAPQARKVLNVPVGNTLFFAGEYLYDGPAMGTVEAALTSGLHAAKQILR